MSNLALDYDGVITANPQFFSQLSIFYAWNKNKVYILTGANYKRRSAILTMLNAMNVYYDYILCRPEDFVSTTKNIGEWKKSQLIEHDIDLWFENDCKFYEQAGVVFDTKTQIIRV